MTILNFNWRSPYLYLMLVPFLWSTNFVLGKIVVNTIPPLTMSTARFTIGVLILSGIMAKSKSPEQGSWQKAFIPLLIMGISGVFGFNSLLYAGLRYTSSTNSSIINSLYPVLAALLAAFFLKERFNARQLIGLFFSIAGVLLVTSRGAWSGLSGIVFNQGDLLVILASLSWAIYSLASKLAMKHLSALQASTYSIYLGLLFLYPASIYELSMGAHVTLSWSAFLALIYLGIVPTAITYILWNKGIQAVGPTKAGYFYNLLPIYTAILAAVFLDESISWYHLAGGLLVLAGVYLGSVVVRNQTEFLRPST